MENKDKMKLENNQLVTTIDISNCNKKNYLIYNILKRTIDIVGSLAGLILLSPVFLIVSILIKLEDPKGKIFFTQDDFVEIGIRAIINHTDLIQIELNSQGNSFQLARIGVTTGRSDYYAIYDSKHFDTTEKRLQLKDKLIELGFDE